MACVASGEREREREGEREKGILLLPLNTSYITQIYYELFFRAQPGAAEG